MRKPIVAGNWKMNLSKAQGVALAKELVAKAGSFGNVDVAVIPAFVHLDAVGQVVAGSPVALGAQDGYFENNGAFTGEISVSMLQDLGVRYVLVGHSERRHILGESDALLNKKLKAIIAGRLNPILCVGETLEQRQGNKTFDIVGHQLKEGLAGVDKAGVANVVVAYEPVWAIGTGVNATAQQAQDVHAFIREQLAKLFDAGVAAALRIQYGGSVKAANAGELMSRPDIDGALVGGASLKVDDFMGIITATAAAKQQ